MGIHAVVFQKLTYNDLFTQSVGLIGRGSARRKVATYIGQHKQNKPTQTSMTRVGFEPMIPVFERVKTFHALDRAATVIGTFTLAYV
jgi:hypothetical protein